MIKSRSKNGVDIDAAQARIEELLVELSKSGDNSEIEAELVTLYEKVSGYKSNCSVCLAGRALFIKSLIDVKNGEPQEALAKMRGSLRSVAFKWARIRASIQK